MWDNSRSESYKMTHRHKGVELHYCKTGHGTYQIGGTQLPLRPGLVTLLWGPMTHQITATGNPFCRSVIHFPRNMLLNRLTSSEQHFREMLPEPSRPCLQFELPSEFRPSFSTTFSELFQEFVDRHTYANTGVSFLLARLFLILARSNMIHQPEPSPTSPHEARLAEQIEDFIDAHVDPTMSVEQIAKMLNRSAGHISRVYKNVRGIPLRDLLNGQRLGIAQHLLRTGASVIETALACGFSTPSNFARFFRRHTGMAPSSYTQWVRKYKVIEDGPCYKPRV